MDERKGSKYDHWPWQHKEEWEKQTSGIDEYTGKSTQWLGKHIL